MRVYSYKLRGESLRILVDGRQTKLTLGRLLRDADLGYQSLRMVRRLPVVSRRMGRKVSERSRLGGRKLFEATLTSKVVDEVKSLGDRVREG